MRVGERWRGGTTQMNGGVSDEHWEEAAETDEENGRRETDGGRVFSFSPPERCPLPG